MPRELTSINVVLTPTVRFGEIRFKCKGGYPTEMIVTVETATPQPDGSERIESVPVVFPFDEFKLWPEFPATYARISGEGWKRFDEDEAKRAASTVSTSTDSQPATEAPASSGEPLTASTTESPTLWSRVTGLFS